MNNNLEFLKESFKIKIKTLKEYKINFYLEFFTSILYSITFLFFILIINSNFSSFLNWSKSEIIFFIILEGVGLLISGMFFYGLNLKNYLISGNLNIFLVRPKNIFLQYFVHIIQIFTGFMGFMYFLIFLVFAILFKISVLKFFLTIILLILSIILFVFSMIFLDSLSFFLKENKFIIKVYKNFSGTFENYPLTMFKNNLFYLGLLSANVYYTAIATGFIFNKISNIQIIYYYLFILLLNLILIFFIYILWKFGLKKYEAFG